MANILILGNSHLVVFGFRGELIERLVSDGHNVTVCFPNGPFGSGEESVKEYGCSFIENKMERQGTNPIKDLSIIREYCSIIRKVKPDVVLAYTVKPDVYGGIACRIMRVPFIPNITGLGKGLVKKGLIQKITLSLYKLAVKKSSCVFFQNDSDKNFFDEHKIKYSKAVIIPGSGVNLNKYSVLPYPSKTEPIRFVFVGRIMKSKGIEQFLSAAHEVKAQYPDVEFHICGYCEENYKSLLDEKVASGEIVYHGLVDDVRTIEKNCHCIVLPSYHPEGISNSLLEGAAIARPLITTNRPGCRDTVDDGVTGLLVKPGDSADLALKMKQFILLPYDNKVEMGIKGRYKIESKFDRQIVVENYIKVLSDVFN